MAQLAYADNLSAYHKLDKVKGIQYAYKIRVSDDGYYFCEGYALANGHKLTTWLYVADDFSDALSDATRSYLLREMKPMAEFALTQLVQLYHQNFG